MLNHHRFTYYQTVMSADYIQECLKNTRDAALITIEKDKTGEIDLSNSHIYTCLELINNQKKLHPGFNSVLLNMRWLFCTLNDMRNYSGFIGAHVCKTYDQRGYGTNNCYPTHAQYFGHPTVRACYRNLRLQWLYFVANQCELYTKETPND